MKVKQYLPVEDSCLLEHVSKIDVGVQKIGVQGDSFFKMMNGKPDFTLCIEYTAKIAPSNGKIRPCLNGFQVACLEETTV